MEQGVVQEVLRALVRAGLAGEYPAGTVLLQELADGVAVVDVVTEKDWAVGG